MWVRACLSAQVLLAVLIAEVDGHGYVVDPPPRNVRQGEYCPQCGNGHGVCGHRPGGQWGAQPEYLDVFDGVRKTYTAGQSVAFKVVITAHHMGHFEFSICDRRINSSMTDPDTCLRKHVLQRVPPEESYSDCVENDARGDCQPLDKRHPERWYLPPKRNTIEDHTMRFKMPDDLHCDECTLQWRWWTANSCIPAKGYGCFFEDLAAAGWDAGEWCGAFCGTCSENGVIMSGSSAEIGCGEEFRNCADIKVLLAGPTPDPVPSPEVVPPASPAPSPLQSVPSPPGPEPESEEEGEEEEDEQEMECQAVSGRSFGATDERCTRACRHLLQGMWPCKEGDMCFCGEPAQAPTTSMPTQEPTISQTLEPTAAPPATTQAPHLPSQRMCLHQTDCDVSPWCKTPGYNTYCLSSGANDHCPTPHCYWSTGGSLAQTSRKSDCSEGGCSSRSTASASLLQLKNQEGTALGTDLVDDSWINVCYFTNWARYRTGLINENKDVFEMATLGAESCSHFMYGFASIVPEGGGVYSLKSNDPNADHPSGSEAQDELCPHACNDPTFQPNWSDPNGIRCDWPCGAKRTYRGYEALNIGMKRKNPGIKGLISVGGWNFNDCGASAEASNGQGAATCEIFSSIAASEDLTRRFAQNVIDFCRRWGFDGFDLDWEYPVVAGHNSVQKEDGKFVSTPQDYVNYISMLRIMKEEFNKEAAESNKPALLLTAAVGVGKNTVGQAYDIPGMNQHLDLINLMTYDLHGGWEPRTGCNAPLYTTEEDREIATYDLSVSWAVDHWIEQGASPSKLTIGLGMYGRGWTLANSANTGFNAPASGKSAPAMCTKEAGYFAYYEVEEALKHGAIATYDEDRGCIYMVQAIGGRTEWVGFDNARSICAKLDFAKSRGLAGSMIWALDLDDFVGVYEDQPYPLVNLAGSGGASCSPSHVPSPGLPAPSPVPSQPVPSPNLPAPSPPAPSPLEPSPPSPLAPSPMPSPLAPSPVPSPPGPMPPSPAPNRCIAVLSNSVGATNAICMNTCGRLPDGWWPCGQGGPCSCTTDVPSPVPPSSPLVPSSPSPPTPSPSTPSPLVPSPPSPSPSVPSPPAPSHTLTTLLGRLHSADSADVFMYNTGTSWLPSDLYIWDDMITAVQQMASRGIGSSKLWIGGENVVYGLVNIAAFLAQCMQETIQYNACDENNWSNGAVVQQAGGTAYSATSACGQMSQSYQNYQCSAEEDATAGGKMACDVDVNMELRAVTRAGWWGAPPQLFCAPRSKVPKAPRWSHNSPSSCSENAFADGVDLDTYWEYINTGGSCKDFPAIKAGGWTFDGCAEGGCSGSPAPLFDVPEGRTDVEGCCWWGRGVIQTTGTCNYGKLNYYLGKRASDEGRDSLFPDIDFCTSPGSICDPDSPPELKWIAGFFYWLNAVQPYEANGWNYLEELKGWVDGGLKLADTGFIDGASGIVNRGCHNPPNCGTGQLHGGTERRNNFKKVLEAMGLA